MSEENGKKNNGDAPDRRMAHRLRRRRYLATLGENTLTPMAPMVVPPDPHPHGHKHAPHPSSVELEKAVEHLREQLARTQAEFDNYRKRQRREEQQRLDLSNLRLIEQMLPVLDNFNRAVASPGDSVQGLLAGIEMVHKQLLDILGQNGLEIINPLDQTFDPNLHEAIGVDPDPDKPENQVAEVFQEGYGLKGRLIRPAMVKVVRH